MTTTPPPPARTPRSGLSRTAKVLLFVVAPVVLLILIVGAVVAGLALTRGATVTETADADGGQRVAVEVADAELHFSPSPDDQVHVRMTGVYFGTRPTLTVDNINGTTTIGGGCPDEWFVLHCSVSIVVTMPADLPLSTQSTNGDVTIHRLDGAIDIETINGRIDTTAPAGDISLHSVNGAIQVRNATSRALDAGTTNGSIDLSFAAAPTTVTANTTNGAITVRVPRDDSTYFIEAQTINGRIDTGAVPSNSDANRTIEAKTANGSVTVERTRR